MERTIRYFERYQLFQNSGRQPERTTPNSLKSVAATVDDWYDSFWDISMKYCDGDIKAAEHFMDTSVFMFYYRIKQKATWLSWKSKQAQADNETTRQ